MAVVAVMTAMFSIALRSGVVPIHAVLLLSSISLGTRVDGSCSLVGGGGGAGASGGTVLDAKTLPQALRVVAAHAKSALELAHDHLLVLKPVLSVVQLLLLSPNRRIQLCQLLLRLQLRLGRLLLGGVGLEQVMGSGLVVLRDELRGLQSVDILGIAGDDLCSAVIGGFGMDIKVVLEVLELLWAEAVADLIT
jgi:hypothetical protein